MILIFSYASKNNPLRIQFIVSDSDCSIVYLEHVVVEMTLSITVTNGGYYTYSDYSGNPGVLYHDGPKRGDILVEMYSPYGTRSVPLVWMYKIVCIANLS